MPTRIEIIEYSTKNDHIRLPKIISFVSLHSDKVLMQIFIQMIFDKIAQIWLQGKHWIQTTFISFLQVMRRSASISYMYTSISSEIMRVCTFGHTIGRATFKISDTIPISNTTIRRGTTVMISATRIKPKKDNISMIISSRSKIRFIHTLIFVHFFKN